MSVSRKWVVCAIAIAVVVVVAGNALAVPHPPAPQQNQNQTQTQNNLWVVPVAILAGAVVIYLVSGLLEAGGI